MQNTIMRSKRGVMDRRVRRLLKASMIEGLARIGTGAKSSLLKALKDEDNRIRYNAASALYTIGARAGKGGKKNPFDEKTWERINHELMGASPDVLKSIPAAHLDQDEI